MVRLEKKPGTTLKHCGTNDNSRLLLTLGLSSPRANSLDCNRIKLGGKPGWTARRLSTIPAPNQCAYKTHSLAPELCGGNVAGCRVTRFRARVARKLIVNARRWCALGRHSYTLCNREACAVASLPH